MKKILLLVYVALLIGGCEVLQNQPEEIIKGTGAITLKFIQMNDVYEIAPLNNGEVGGLARVAHIRDSIKVDFPNTFLFLAGDFLSPSVLGSLSLDGEKINGKQMIEVLNAMEIDLATFGNHEFDLSEEELQKRINESTFTWTTANVRHVTEKELEPFAKQLQFSPLPTSDYSTFNAVSADGNKIKFGVFGVTLPSNPKPYVAYGDIYKESERAYNLAIEETDFVVGLTHVAIDQDIKIAAMFSELPLIMGGHEHYNMLERQGRTLITKADANARTVYIHTVIFNLRTKQLNVASELFPVTSKIASSAKVDRVVKKWTDIQGGLMNDVIPTSDNTVTETKPIQNTKQTKTVVAKKEPVKITEKTNKDRNVATFTQPKAKGKTSDIKIENTTSTDQKEDKSKADESNITMKSDQNEAILDNPKIEIKQQTKPNVIYKLSLPLDGTDKANRSEQTNFGELITKSMAYAYDRKVDGAIVNGGSIRLDDKLTGDVTKADIFRALPFGGSVLKVNIMGSLLREVLEFGELQKGNGAFLQRYNFTKTTNGYWKNEEKVINDRKIYTIAISDYLLKGLDIPFLTADNVGIVEVYTPKEQENASDIRKAIIAYLNSLPQ